MNTRSNTASLGHRAYVRAVRVVPGPSPFAVSVGYDGFVRTHGLPELTPGVAMHAHALGAGALDVTPDGRVITAGADGVVRFWTVSRTAITLTSTVPMPILDEDPLIETACWMPDGRTAMVGVVGGSIWEVDPVAGTASFVDEEGLLSINAIVPSSDGQMLFIASDECTVRRYRRQGTGWVLEHRSLQFDDHVDALALRTAADGVCLVAVTHGRALWRCDAPFGDLAFCSRQVARDGINALAWAGDRVLLGGDDRHLYLVDPWKFDVVDLADTSRDIDGIAVVNHRQALVATTGGLVAVDLADRHVTARSQDRGALAAVVVDGDRVLAGQHDAGRIHVGRLSEGGGETLGVIEVEAPVSCAAASRAVFGLSSGLVLRVDGMTAEPLFRAEAEVEGVEVDAENGLVLAVDRAGVLYIQQDVPKTDESVLAHRSKLDRVQVTGWGRRLKSVRVVRSGGRCLALCAGKGHRLHAVDLADLAAGAWEITGSNVALRTFNDVLFAEGRVFAASWDRTIHRLDLAGVHTVGAVEPVLVGHTHAVERLGIVDDTLLSVSYDGTLRGWPLDPGLEPWSLTLSPMAVRRLTASNLPGRIVTAGYDGVVREVDVRSRAVARLWNVTPWSSHAL